VNGKKKRKNNMKIVFLDIDGVLIPGNGSFAFSKVACKNLNSLLKQVPDLKIVISSSWRHAGMESVKKTLQNQKVDYAKVIDITGDERGERGIQIQAWIDKHSEVTHFVCLDDDSDFSNMMDRLVRTNPNVGLTEADVKKAIDILNKKR
jgi:hypothetical protein